MYKPPSGKYVIDVKSLKPESVHERSRLLPKNSTEGGYGSDGKTENAVEGVTVDKVIFVAILVCCFLCAFDFTVIAAIFPLMYFPLPVTILSPFFLTLFCTTCLLSKVLIIVVPISRV